MTNNEIEAFIATIEHGSISAAAQELYVGQPTLSARIRTLEEELGVTLFTRKRGQRITELTPDGKKFEPYARKWKELWDNTQFALNNEIDQTLSVASGYSINSYIMPEVYSRLVKKVKGVALRMDGNHYTEVFRLLETGDVDVGFVPNLRYSRQLQTHSLYREELVVITGKKGRMSGPVHPSELSQEKEVHLAWDSNYSQWYKYWFGGIEHVGVQSCDIVFAIEAVAQSDRWAVVPVTIAKLMEKRGMLYQPILESPKPKITSMLCRKDFDHYPVLPELLHIMKRVVTELGAEWIFEEI
ncbi:LysR family transcriptional regulator [Hespellia stercorisuis]|uniref:DNA-binding transcriptional regulator, LysR family n=1 Tax=Hespellia stercorisuis DSM 15480 TaxID=1121950 RepID=A0A1M6J873_9FIRM|nr:LysR family transcriptional regulator [Hespellia stercorisuis]SHJ42923.1 DNA-binding transcriptional regulator, LysR family [Hespellia stercorisuis DSM 15480]